MGESGESANTSGGRRTKVARLIEEYELQGAGAELEQRWTAEEDRHSLRDLAEYFNLQLLEHALEAADVQYLDGELQNTYRLLTSDEVSSAETTRIERRLERDGIDANSLSSDFVTYQAIRTYLRDDRGAEYTPSETDPIARGKTNVQKLRGRMESVAEGELEQLRKADEITLGEFRTLVDVQVICEDCNSQFDLLKLLDRGGCHCSEG